MAKKLTIGARSLRYVCPNLSKKEAERIAPLLAHAMAEFKINTPDRAAMFIAQLAHESGEFRYREELASGSAYEGRRDLGNIHMGDGRKFKGRGYIQITGRANYEKVGKAFHNDKTFYTRNPELLANSTNSARSAAWWWKNHGLNEIADRKDIAKATKTINGGYNGFEERKRYYKKANRVKRFLTPKYR